MKPVEGKELGEKVGRSERFMVLLPEVKDSLLGVKSFFSLLLSGGEGGGGGVGVASRTVTSDLSLSSGD